MTDDIARDTTAEPRPDEAATEMQTGGGAGQALNPTTRHRARRLQRFVRQTRTEAARSALIALERARARVGQHAEELARVLRDPELLGRGPREVGLHAPRAGPALVFGPMAISAGVNV